MTALLHKFLLGFLLWFGMLLSGGANPQVAFDAANSQYEESQYLGAANSYASLTGEGYTEAALYYNLGNASFRAGNQARALLNYERALLLEPNHKEAWQNLMVAAAELKTEPKFPSKVPRWLAFTSENAFLFSAVVFFWLAVLLVMFLRGKRKVLAVPFGIAAILAFLGFLIYLLLGPRHDGGRVTAKEPTEMRVGPVVEGTTIATLNPGSAVTTKSFRGDWVYVETPEGQLGWMPSDSVEKRIVW